MTVISSAPLTKGKYYLDDAVSLTGFGIYNIYLFVTIGGFLMCVIIETMSMMFIVPAAKCDLNLSLAQQGLLSSISFFGVVAASYVWGFLADTRGRRNVMIISLVSSFLTSIVCCFITNGWIFIVLRFINGGCIGGASSITYAYIGEFHNDKLRPKIVAGVATFVAVGNTYLPGMAWLVLPQDWTIDLEFLDLEFRPWRFLMIIYSLPSVLFTIMLCFLPETPKFLLTKGKHDEVLDILKTMFHVNKGLSKDDYVVTGIIWDDLDLPKPNSFLRTLWLQTAPLFQRQLLFKSIGVSMLQFGVFASTSGMIMWYPTILNTMSHFIHERPNDSLTLCKSIYWEGMVDNDTLVDQGLSKECNDDVKPEVFLVSLVIGLVYTCVYIFIGLLINVIGKKNLLCLFIVVGTIAGLISQYVQGYELIQIMMGIFVIGGVEVSVVNTIVVDLFPTQYRAMALAMSLMFGRLGAMVGTNIVGPLIYNWCDYLFYVFTVNHIILMVVIFLLPTNQPLKKKLTDKI